MNRKGDFTVFLFLGLIGFVFAAAICLATLSFSYTKQAKTFCLEKGFDDVPHDRHCVTETTISKYPVECDGFYQSKCYWEKPRIVVEDDR